jgi:hypothetical protein
MTENEAITLRHSVRHYKDLPIEDVKCAELNRLIKECNSKSGLNIQLVLDNPECFKTLMNHYGWITGAKNYIALVGKKSVENLDEVCGYYGQKLVLAAQMMSLNTCWIAGTYKKGKCRVNIASDEKIVCIIALGYGESQGVEHKSKPLEKLCNITDEKLSSTPVWFKAGVDAALKAPTALNQQKFFITLDGENVTITASNKPMAHIDLGIVEYNFEVGSGKKVFGK